MAMVMIQTNEPCDSSMGTFRRQLEKMILDKHEDIMSRMGAILASGILDAAEARSRAKKDAEQKALEKSTTDDTSTSSSSGNGLKSAEKNSDTMQVDSTVEKKVEAEPTFEILTNPARVVPAQEKFIRFLEGSRYVPVKLAPSRFVLLRDLRPSEAEVLVLTDAPASMVSPASGTGTIGQLRQQWLSMRSHSHHRHLNILHK